MTSTTAQPRVLRCTGTADFLAALPQLAGFTAGNSLFVVFFRGKRAGSTMRMGLPPDEQPHRSLAFLDALVALCREMGAAEGPAAAPAFVISCEQTFAACGGPPWRRFARRLERRMRRERIGVRELALVAPDGWIGFLDPAAPARGRPLAEISTSPVASAAAPPDLTELARIPEPDPARAAAVAEALEATPAHSFEPFDAFGSVRAGAEHDLLAWVAETGLATRALRFDAAPLSPEDAARVIRCAEHSDTWFTMALALLTRPEYPLELVQEGCGDRFFDVPVDIDADGAPVPVYGWSIRRVLESLCPQLDERERHRFCDFRERLRQLVAETPTPLRPGLLAFSAWVWWMSGLQSIAQQQVREALAIEPDHELAGMVAVLTDLSLLPHLAFDPTEPAEPTGPTGPGPAEPTEPTESDAAEPTEPDPAEPTAPTEQTEPARTDRGRPAHPDRGTERGRRARRA